MIPPSDIYGLSSFSTFFYKIELSSSNESNCLTHQKSYNKQCQFFETNENRPKDWHSCYSVCQATIRLTTPCADKYFTLLDKIQKQLKIELKHKPLYHDLVYNQNSFFASIFRNDPRKEMLPSSLGNSKTDCFGVLQIGAGCDLAPDVFVVLVGKRQHVFCC